jgi:AcrR family transcriptional regulator
MARAKRAAAKAYHHGDLRRALLDRAREVIDDSGIEGVKMSELSKDLGVSVAAPFRHFATREALLVELAHEGADKMLQAMNEAAQKETDPLEAQRAIGVAYVRFAVTDPAYFRLLSRPEITEASERLRALSASQQELMDPILGRVHQGEVSRDIVKRSAGMLAAQALTYGLARMIMDGLLGPVSADEAERLAVELTGVLGEGLIEREPSPVDSDSF